MKVKELIKELQNMDPELECIAAIDHKTGFKKEHRVNYFPIEDIFGVDLERDWADNSIYNGFCEDAFDNNKVVLYI